MQRVLLCGEGDHDIGNRLWNARTKAYESHDGWLQCISRKLSGECVVEFDVVRRIELLFGPREQRKYQPLPAGHGARALAAKLRGTSSGYDLVVFMADADSNSERDWVRVKTEIEDGFSRVEGCDCVACVPMSASESWLLADVAAWGALGFANAAAFPSRPEAIWGNRNDPEGGHPHAYFTRVCAQAGLPDSRETREKLAVGSDVNTLEEKCPISFQAFRNDWHKVSGHI